jgi:anti-sigma regulatory factor (Ser/Thr protein kinase)
MPDALRLTLACDLAETARLAAAVEAFAEARALPPDAAAALSIALEEIVANVIRHGYGDNRDGPVHVEVGIDGGRVVAVVEDRAPPFDPFALPPPDTGAPLEDRAVGGLGVHLVRTLMDEAVYAGTPAGNRVTLIKLIAPADGD